MVWGKQKKAYDMRQGGGARRCGEEIFFFRREGGKQNAQESRGLGDVYERQEPEDQHGKTKKYVLLRSLIF